MRYRFERRIGAGGMAEVYEATLHGDDGFRRKVAIKRIAAGRDHAASRRAFVDEARIAGALNHSGIVAVLDFGIVDGSPVQVLEWVDGADAARLVTAGLATGSSMPIAAALHVIREVAEALHHAHQAKDAGGVPLGVVHRDVKPANVLVAWSGHVKLGDFGIALARERSDRTATGMVKGTAAYMAPEQLAAATVDARADVHGLGATLHALVTGDVPFDSALPPAARLDGSAIRVAPDLPPPLAALIARAVALRPDDRHPTARSFADAADDVARALGLGDGRAALADWLTELRPRLAARRGVLDDLVALDLNMVVVGVDAGARRFTMERDEPPPPPTPPRRRRWLAVGAASAVVGSIAAVVIAFGGGGPAGQPANAARADAATAAITDATPATIAATELDAGVLPDATPAPTVAVVSRARSSPSRATGTGSAADRGPPAATDDAADGWISIGGPDLHLGEIHVDGIRRFTAPRRFQVPVGTHRIQVVRADGTIAGPVEVVVTERHTRSRPLVPEL